MHKWEKQLLFKNDQVVHYEILSDIDYQELIPNISSPDNICNIADDKSDEEDSSLNEYTGYTDNICF